MSDVKTFKEKYKPIHELGDGGQGTTWKCGEAGNEYSWVAVKVLKKQSDEERRSRMRRETAALKTLNHENIPKLLDTNSEYWRDQSYKLFITTEFIHGTTLGVFDLSHLDFDQKLKMILKLCEVVGYCHLKGIVHRDIKPDNVILRGNVAEDPVLLDFGLSFNAEDDNEGFKTPEDQHLGNRFLILPDLKVGDEDKRDLVTDVTCLTGLLFYVLTGKQPTVLEDRKVRKPHQREEAKAIIDGFEQHQKDLINSIFDVGFDPAARKRWHSVEALMAEIKNLLLSKANPMETRDDMLTYIRSVAERPANQHVRDRQKLLGEAGQQVLNAENRVVKKLGDDWTGAMAMLGDSGKYLSEGYDREYSITNTVYQKQFRTYRKVFITGDELVVTVIMENPARKHFKKEVFRRPVEGEMDWNGMEERLMDHYISVIATELRG